MARKTKVAAATSAELEQQIHLVRWALSLFLVGNAVISARNNILTVSVPTNRNDEVAPGLSKELQVIASFDLFVFLCRAVTLSRTERRLDIYIWCNNK